MSQDGCKRSNVLQLEEEIQWFRGFRITPSSPVGGREYQVKANRSRSVTGQANASGRIKKKALNASQLRGLAMNLIEDYRVSVRKASAVVMLNRSVWYYKPKDRDEQHILMRMNEIASTRVRYGFWRIFTLLRREGFKDNHKRVYRLYIREGLNLRSKRHRRCRAEQHRENYAPVNQINQCWSMDFVSDQLYNGQRFRALTIIDNYSRRCLAIEIGQSLKGCDVVNTLESLYEHYGIKPERIKVDNGPEFVSKELDRWAYERKVALNFSRPGNPTDNPFIESFNGSFRDECLNTNWFLSLHDARLKIDSWRRDYNTYRPHSSLQGLTPEEVEYEMLNDKENSNLALSS